MGKLLILLLVFLPQAVLGQIKVTIDAGTAVKAVSPYLYGRNNSFTPDPGRTLSEVDLVRLRDAGVRFFRESGGNNASKYNWRRKLASHPDWYNNVYAADWDYAARTLQQHFPDAQGMWAFPLLGYAAKTGVANFPDWEYNRSQWWEGVNQNLAGGGEPAATGTKAKVGGNTNLYLEKWSADSTVGILDHWFGSEGIGLNPEGIRYWNMDNEPEIWSGTHDDVMLNQLSPQEFMQRYFEVARKARAKFPGIKLAGPVTANEWQWYNWDGKPVTENGKTYPWLEYFIKSIAEEQERSGVRLLDVLDIHFYPSTKKTEEVVQLHRVFFDRTYIFPEANGVKTITGGYDNTLTREYIFARCNEWLTQYLGTGHGVTLGLTETGIDESIAPSVTAVWYASTLGEFMKNGVEVFTPWTWKTGMWETLHLFSRYSQPDFLQAVSENETLVSTYPTLNAARDSMTVILVNRSAAQQQVHSELNDFVAAGSKAPVYTLAQLPATETFFSHTENALKESAVDVSGSTFGILLPPMSVSAVVLRGGGVITGMAPETEIMQVFPNPSRESFIVKWTRGNFETLQMTDSRGRIVFEQQLDKREREVRLKPKLSSGTYLIRLVADDGKSTVKKVVLGSHGYTD
ncbi:glycoside hydrolase family 44 protein [Dyadobacter sandarakinus]|uniref:T9SS type A sorting domain-containing protein n=1 Tax=Dyadobacter sandarakinus TaxID=2747268 RepID=A0ABX7I3X2_9BACT|nr:glycoside hydrolase family 44 protein [Dyadobacter sandarakinus]QRR00262.1 T9SS type A sorting domain-containing protein [Dyadobacter sandarakinus]